MGQLPQLGVSVDDMYPTNKAEYDINDTWECSTVVSHVCSRWRKCALKTPSLWNRIFWDGGSWDKAATWVARSRAAKLEIDLFLLGDANADGTNEQITKALFILIPHLPRWYSVDIKFRTYVGLFQVLEALQGKAAPELRRLVFSCAGGEGYDEAMFPPMSLLDGPGSAPKLQSVTLWSTPMSLSDVPWNPSLMSRLDLAYSPEGMYLCKLELLSILTIFQIPVEWMPPRSHLPQILNSFTNLRYLYLSSFGCIWDPSDAIPEDSILLPNVQYISFHLFERSQPLEQLIRCLKTPALKHLNLEDLFDADGLQADHADFAPTLTVLSRRIKAMSLELEKVAILNVYTSTREALVNLFKSFRKVKHIHFSIQSIYPFDSPYIDLLGPLRPGFSLPVKLVKLCPNVETLAFSGFDGTVLTNIALQFYVAGRQLKKMWYSGMDDVDEDQLSALKGTVVEVLKTDEIELDSELGAGDSEDDWEDVVSD